MGWTKKWGQVTTYNPVISCVSSTDCFVVEGGPAFQFNGSSWTSMGMIDGSQNVIGLSCPVQNFCVAADAVGYTIQYQKTTVSWTQPADVDSTRAMNAVTCPSATFCVSVGASGYATTYNGSAWSTASDADSTRSLTDVSCVSATFCWAVDASGYAVEYTGSWQSPKDIDGSRRLGFVQCVSTTFCVAVGASGYAVTYNGSSWTATDADSTRTLDAVSCTSSTFCEAVDASGYAVKYTGSWGTPGDVDGSRSMDSVDCTSTTFCAAVGASGYTVIYGSSGWSAASDTDSTRLISEVQCTSSTFCMATDTSGYVLEYTGSWGTPTGIDGLFSPLNTLWCTSSTFCVTGDAHGNVLVFNGTSWSLRLGIDLPNDIASVSCPTTTFCAVVDQSGDAMTYQPTSATTSQLTWDANGSLPLLLSDGSFDYVYGPTGAPVEQVNLTTSAVTFLTYTPSDSSWLSTNAAGAETGFWTYDAYGNLSSGTPTSAFGFAGQYTDSTSGLTNLRARFYQPQTGTFTTRDPAFAATDDAYTYAGGDPVNSVDPTGLCWIHSWNINGNAACPTTAGAWRSAVQASASAGSCGGFFGCGLEGLANYGAGIANAVVSTVTFGQVQIPMPFCQLATAGWSYDVGMAWGLVASAVGGGVALDTVRGALLAGDAAEAGLGAEGAGQSSSDATAIYRGISSDHAFFEEAQQGIARPGDLEGVVDAVLHNEGITSVTRLTSWSTDRAIAEVFAGKDGVILETTLEEMEAQGVNIVASPDRYGEDEVLLEGLIRGLKVTQP